MAAMTTHIDSIFSKAVFRDRGHAVAFVFHKGLAT
jgi:hypothetical protein